MLHSSFMLLSFITFKSFKWYNIKASITQVSEGKRRAFHHEINSISRASSTHTGKGEIFVLREKHSYFKSTNMWLTARGFYYVDPNFHQVAWFDSCLKPET